mmetsp:Transcript_25446/g.57788  ORF Transcript_25446/g.57788 Transcript_25446/m.57788 type:complete len:284 (-) Transcript_25446:198-1049(-)
MARSGSRLPTSGSSTAAAARTDRLAGTLAPARASNHGTARTPRRARAWGYTLASTGAALGAGRGAATSETAPARPMKSEPLFFCSAVSRQPRTSAACFCCFSRRCSPCIRVTSSWARCAAHWLISRRLFPCASFSSNLAAASRWVSMVVIADFINAATPPRACTFRIKAASSSGESSGRPPPVHHLSSDDTTCWRSASAALRWSRLSFSLCSLLCSARSAFCAFTNADSASFTSMATSCVCSFSDWSTPSSVSISFWALAISSWICCWYASEVFPLTHWSKGR